MSTDRLAHDLWIAAEMGLPQPVADHRDRSASRRVVLGREKCSAQDGPHAEDIEIVRRGQHAPDTLGLAFACQAHGNAVARRDTRKTLLPVAHGFEIWIGKREGIVTGLAQRERHDLAGMT